MPLLKHHDRAAFDVTCYSSYRGGDDEITRELRACADSWRSVAAMSDEQLAKQIRGDQIDILIDLAGHSASNRLLTFARRPAPVQMTYLGYPDTTGMAGMDFRLTDAHADPPGAEDGTERLIRLQRTAWCFRAPPDSPEVSTAPHSGITFGSFNNLWKLNDDVLRLWARVLDAAEGSRLIIKAAGLGNESAQQRIISVFQSCGVDAERIELRPPVPRFADHLAAYADIDIALDAWPYHGTTTTCEALWMGAPVVTLAGDVHASRVGVSLLTNAGLPELIAKNADDYVATAAALAADRGRNRDLRTTLRQRMLASPLMDATRFARDVETALRDAWMQKQA